MFVRKTRRGGKPRPKKGASKAATDQGKSSLDQRHFDLIGLGLILLGIYLVFVLYFGWEGGRLGSGISDALTYIFGLVAYATPVALFAAGAVLVFRPSLPSTRPLRTGAAFLLAGLLLAFAAGTFGAAGGRGDSVVYFDSGWFPGHGGVLGESMYWLSATLLQPFGAHLIAVFALIAGLLLLTGTTVAAVLSRSGSALKKAGTTSAEATRVLTRAGNRAAADADGAESEETGVTGDEEQTAFMGDEEQTAFIGGEEPTTAIADGSAWTSPIEVDIWAEEGGEPTISANTEPLEPIEIFPGGDSRDAVAPDADEPTAEVELPETIVDDFDDELAGLEEEVEEPAVPSPLKPKAGEQLPLTPMGKERGATRSEQVTYRPPPLKVLDRGKKDAGPDPVEQKELARKLVETLGHFGVEASIVGVVTGPHVSRFELQLAPGTKVKKVSELANDIAYALASTDIRILAPIPGKQAVGVEVPNSSRNMVKLGDIYKRTEAATSPLRAWLGKGIDGKQVSTDLATMPHVLVAGTTGSGKSGCVNAILSSILMHSSPNEVRLVLVDPKQVELNHYEAVPHLLTPVVTNPKLAANVLSNLIAEMESRYSLMKGARARNIIDYNRIQAEQGEPGLPYILCVIDELADLMMVAPADVESSIIRLAQKSRATGIHLVLATQRPSTDIITGTIKVNIPSRIAFAVSSQTDSRVILDQGGAESLLGQGDMLFRGPGTSKLQRIQGAFVSEEEIARITDHWSAQGEPDFEEELLDERTPAKEDPADRDVDPDQDDLLDEAIQMVVDTETASVSMIQRRLRVGYTRAGRLVDMLERRGVISGYEGSKPRQVLITAADLPRVLAGDADEETPELEPVAVTAGDAPADADPGEPTGELPEPVSSTDA
jgi:S-DNA-T family DNA segregation ATPase FtsK/SpoIIIE